MLLLLLLVHYALPLVESEKIYYDSFYEYILTDAELKQRIKDNKTLSCVVAIEPCDPNEGRRVDGSCNNLQHPTRGAANTPLLRLLPAVYDKDFGPKKTKSGNEMPLARRIRTTLLAEGRVPNQKFTHLLTDFFLFIASDNFSVQDTLNYILITPYCCLPKGKTDYMCTPVKVPDDDPVHRFSNVRCLNLTRPISYQTSGCINNKTTPERINPATPVIDLSLVYVNDETILLEKSRKKEKGLLKHEIVNGRIWPPSWKTPNQVCVLNESPHETRCHDIGVDTANSLFGVNIFCIWFWRLHNHIAQRLAKINPCWDDDKLFYTARDINIAIALQIFYYEMLPELLGRDNMIRDGILSSSKGFRDVYNVNIPPQLALEFPFVLRWVHLMQEGTLRFYDKDGCYLKQSPIANFTLRTGYLALDDNIVHMTQGTFRQASAKVDYIVDPHVAEVGMGPLQHALDVPTNDLSKDRLFGFQPYIKYLEYCNGRSFKNYKDLAPLIDPERIELLKDIYEDIEDIDLLAGIWVERLMHNTSVPPTFYCLVTEQLIRNVVSDRHWFERPNRPNAFTPEQLKQIRKASISRLVCDVGDSVTQIQPRGFLRIGPKNKMCSCNNIERINFDAWKDNKCRKNQQKKCTN